LHLSEKALLKLKNGSASVNVFEIEVGFPFPELFRPFGVWITVSEAGEILSTFVSGICL
jgi:hypothetical protein